MDGRTEPNNCTGTNWYGGTRFWYDIIWFGSWYEVYLVRFVVRDFGTKFWYESKWFGSCSGILVRNSVVRFVFGLLVRDFRTVTKSFGSVRIFQTIAFLNRTEQNQLRTGGTFIHAQIRNSFLDFVGLSSARFGSK